MNKQNVVLVDFFIFKILNISLVLIQYDLIILSQNKTKQTPV